MEFADNKSRELKKNRIIIIAFALLVGVLGFGGMVDAKPSVSSVSGGVVDGESFTISGSDFGNKATAAPLKYDDFETDDNNHEHGDKIYDGDWYLRTPATCLTEYWTINSRTGSTKHVRADYDDLWNGSGGAQQGSFAYIHGATLSPVYITMWLRWDWNSSSSLNQIKFLYVTPEAWGPGNEPNILNIWQWGAPGPPTWTANAQYEDQSYWSIWSGTASTQEVWFRMEWYYKETTSPGTADGIVMIWRQQGGVGNTFTLEANYKGNAKTDSAEGEQHDHWEKVAIMDYGRAMDHMIELDDIYIDNTQARVEIGDNPNWDFCTHREIQIPTAWSNDSITINVNQGSFNDSETVYLFVVDENGTSSEGYPVTFSVGGHKADLNDDGIINMPELMAFIGRWKANDGVTRQEVEEARGIWFTGGIYP